MVLNIPHTKNNARARLFVLHHAQLLPTKTKTPIHTRPFMRKNKNPASPSLFNQSFIGLRFFTGS